MKRKPRKGPWVLLLGINAFFWETGHLVQRKTHPASPQRELTTCATTPWHHVCHWATSFPPGTGLISVVQTGCWVHPTKTPIKLLHFSLSKSANSTIALFNPAEQTHRPHPLFLKCFKESTLKRVCKGNELLRVSNTSYCLLHEMMSS